MPVHCRYEYDGQPARHGVVLYLAAQFITVRFRHHDIADEYVRIVLQDYVVGFLSGSCRKDFPEMPVEFPGNEFEQIGLIFRYQNRKLRSVYFIGLVILRPDFLRRIVAIIADNIAPGNFTVAARYVFRYLEPENRSLVPVGRGSDPPPGCASTRALT